MRNMKQNKVFRIFLDIIFFSMKETIVKSIVSGVTFFMTVGLLFVAYASGAFNLPATA